MAIYKRVPDPQNPGSLIPATPVGIVSGESDASIELHLDDGAKILVTISVIEVSKIDDRRSADGHPIYNIDTQAKIKLNPAPSSTQGVN